jgi:L-amino acid N-acyltransferase YncA
METPNAIRDARESDCETIADIYNEGIAEGRSTFETEPRSTAEIAGWLASSEHLVLVVETDRGVMGWGRLSPYSSRACYAGIAEASVYVRASARGQGLGGALAAHLRDHSSGTGLHKLLGKVFAENAASRALCARYGFREVGTHLKHGRIGGRWIDVIVVELLLDSTTPTWTR